MNNINKSLTNLRKHLPNEAFSFVEKWMKPYSCDIKISKARNSKLGDYRYTLGRKKLITINENLEPQLFFFVLTHEIAHLITLSYNEKILPHGKEWKTCYRNLLLESICAYSKDFQPLVIKFSENPKASYSAAYDIVKYFNKNSEGLFIDDLPLGSKFEYKGGEFELLSLRKKNYICVSASSGKKYIFSNCVRVKKIYNDS